MGARVNDQCPSERRDTDPGRAPRAGRGQGVTGGYRGTGNWKSRKDRPLEPPEGAQPCGTVGSDLRAPEGGENMVLLF